MLNVKKMLTKMLADTGWIALTSNVSYRIKNGYCTVVIEGATVGTTAIVLATLPNEARPSIVVNPYLHANYVVGQCWITTSGEIYTRFQAQQTGTVAGFCTYPVD